MLLLWTQGMGCLVTEPKTIEREVEVPPLIMKAPGSAIEVGEPFWIDREGATEWALPVVIRDENVDDELEARWRVNRAADPAPSFQTAVLPGGDSPIREELSLTIGFNDIADDECHQLELIVARTDDFVGTTFNFVLPGRFSRVHWVVFEGSPEEAEGPGPPATTCGGEQLSGSEATDVLQPTAGSSGQ